MQQYWWLVSFFASFIFAMYIFANQIFKLKGSLIMIYRGLGTGLFLLLFVPFIPHQFSPTFYYMCIFQGFLIAYLDNRLFNAANRFGAEVTSVIQPISVLFGFVLWFILVPQQFFDLCANPLRLALISASVLGMVFSVLMLKKNPLNQLALLYLLPALLTVTVLDIQGKVLMYIGRENVLAAIFYYSLITSLVAGSINAIAFFNGGGNIREVFVPRNILYAGVPVMVLILSMYTLKNYSLYLGSNPAYVMAIIYAYPIWVLLANNVYSRYVKHQDYAKPSKRVLISMVISIIVLILTV